MHTSDSTDFHGVLGLDANVRYCFERRHVRFDANGSATRHPLHRIVEESQARSAVFDVITAGVAVAVVGPMGRRP